MKHGLVHSKIGGVGFVKVGFVKVGFVKVVFSKVRAAHRNFFRVAVGQSYYMFPFYVFISDSESRNHAVNCRIQTRP